MHYHTQVSASYPMLLKANAYLVEFPISAVKHHLEGDVGPILDAWDPRCGRIDADAPRRAGSLEIADDKLVCARRGVEVVKGLGGSRGGKQHPD